MILWLYSVILWFSLPSALQLSSPAACPQQQYLGRQKVVREDNVHNTIPCRSLRWLWGETAQDCSHNCSSSEFTSISYSPNPSGKQIEIRTNRRKSGQELPELQGALKDVRGERHVLCHHVQVPKRGKLGGNEKCASQIRFLLRKFGGSRGMVRTEPRQRWSSSNVQSQSEAALVLLQPPVLPQVCLGPVVISERGQQVRLSPTRKNAPWGAVQCTGRSVPGFFCSDWMNNANQNSWRLQ